MYSSQIRTLLWTVAVISVFTSITAKASIFNNRVDDFFKSDDCNLPPALREEIQGYQPIVNQIVDNIVRGDFSGDTYKSLEKMTDKFGPRLAGSESLENAIDYMVDEFKKAGLENVHTEDAMVPHWVRGYENAQLILPRKANIQILGLGYSVGTPRGGIVGDVVVVESFRELLKIPDEKVKGKIVVFVPPWTTYGETAQYRVKGASAASKKGAIASLIRSATPFSIGTPHTGMQAYEHDVNPIPTACITVEDAEMFLRLYRGGEQLQIRLEMADRLLPPVKSRNTIGELIGTTYKNTGEEIAEMISPRNANIQILGLGSTVATPKSGILADVVVVESFNELRNLSDSKVKGKILVFVPEWKGYGETVQYRTKGASEASRKGAIATLIRSIAPFSIGSPHTGMQSYERDVNPIPTACITIEDAEMLLRLYRKGEKIQIRLQMADRNLTPVKSRNTIGELIGTTYKNTSVVVVSGHLDSWDVGVGAMDDGGGAFISWKAVEYLKKLNLRPKRTIRAILWTGEEVGIWGGSAYKKSHESNEKEEFNFLMESDGGTFEPRGLDFSGNHDAQCIFKEIMKLMKPLKATMYGTSASLPDLTAWLRDGFPGASLNNKNEKYFWFHHTAGDTMLVEDPKNLDKGTALFAAASFIIADLSIDIPKDFTNFVDIVGPIGSDENN